MTKQNSTLAYYEKNAESYAARDFSGTFEEYRDLFVASVKESRFKKQTCQGQEAESSVSPKPKVLELGSGSGRDAQNFLTHDFDVTPVDGSAVLARIAKERTGLDVLVMDFADLDFEAEFDGVWAAASLLHVPSEKLPGVLKSVKRSLRENGVLVASFKENDNDWHDDLGRYFCAMTESHLADLISNSGFELSAIEKKEGKGSDGKPTVWLWVVAQKQTLAFR
ncbi:class I SAM-dependent methyltransferase [Kiloniella sp. EL199]|uniref:class I SAM-dependent DNA methyltransferase n=1 Tax=Kiloniella sp. EL199 TaxID=2107581 RepID=UPI000EA29774|nr:class I SAM-dependent methyltransferase [Kiloniella sp. EL199]